MTEIMQSTEASHGAQVERLATEGNNAKVGQSPMQMEAWSNRLPAPDREPISVHVSAPDGRPFDARPADEKQFFGKPLELPSIDVNKLDLPQGIKDNLTHSLDDLKLHNQFQHSKYEFPDDRKPAPGKITGVDLLPSGDALVSRTDGQALSKANGDTLNIKNDGSWSMTDADGKPVKDMGFADNTPHYIPDGVPIAHKLSNGGYYIKHDGGQTEIFDKNGDEVRFDHGGVIEITRDKKPTTLREAPPPMDYLR